MHLIEKRTKIQNQFSFWPQSFHNYFNSPLKNGLPPVLKAGSSGIINEIPTQFPTITFCDNNPLTTKEAKLNMEKIIAEKKVSSID